MELPSADIMKAQPPRDPIFAISVHLLESTQGAFGEAAISRVPYNVSEKDIAEHKKEWAPGLLLHLRTDNWGVRREAYGVEYIFRYRAVAKVLQFPTEELLWQGVCQIGGLWEGDRLSFDDLVENEGAELRKLLERSADQCARQLKEQFQLQNS